MLADFVAGFVLLFFVGKVLRKILQENPRKILQILYNKNPRHISAEGPGRAKIWWKGGLFENIHVLEVLESTPEILEISQSVDNKGESDHCLELLEILEFLEIPKVKRPLS